uniref:Uncharacterized protein n=1 Tax=Arundo donax TaxID=35708 RepID=A0A0A9CBW9_ARUDO
MIISLLDESIHNFDISKLNIYIDNNSQKIYCTHPRTSLIFHWWSI